MEGSRENSKFW